MVAAEFVDEFQVEYDNIASDSYLVIKAGKRCDVIRYQAEMVSTNSINHILPFETKFCDDIGYCYYNITSRLPLQAYLKRRKLTGNEFIGILSDISGTIINSSGYMLSANSFLVKASYIYIDPAACDMQMVYLPVRRQCNISADVRDMVADLILNHIKLEGSTKDDYLQRVLEYVRDEAFNITGFHKFLEGFAVSNDECRGNASCNEKNYNMNNPVYNQIPEKSDDRGVDQEAESLIREEPDKKLCQETIAEESGCNKSERDECLNTKAKSNGISRFPIISAIILLQIIIVGAFLVCLKYLPGSGRSQPAALAAVLMFSAAAEILLFGKLLPAGLIKMGKSYVTSSNSIPASVLVKGVPDIQSENILSGNAEVLESDCSNEDSHNSITGCKNNLAGMSNSDSSVYKVDSSYSEYKTVMLSPELLKQPYLVEKYNPHAEKIFLDKPEYIIGRLEGQVDYVSGNMAVGKIHACITGRKGIYHVTDLNSVNGTYIDGVRIDSNREYEIKNNCTLAFANSEYLFVSCNNIC